MAIFKTFFKMENVFYYILERKDAFLGYKKIEVQKVQKLRFLRGLSHCFGPKMAIFLSFCF